MIMAKCKDCKHLDSTQRTRRGYCTCTNTNRITHSKYGGCRTVSDLKAPWAKACKTGFEPREKEGDIK